MIFLFDYIFFKVTHFYLQISDDESNYIMGSVVLSILQMLNIITIMMILSMYFKQLALFFDISNIERGKFTFLIFGTILFTLNIYKYSKVTTYDHLKQKWIIEKDIKRKKRILFVIAYILSSIILLIISIKIYK